MRMLLTLLLTLALAGCDKKTDVFMFDCVVFDLKVNGPVAGASVVMKVQRAAGGFNPNYETVGSAVTDANGRFYIEVDKDVYYSFRVEVSHPQHFSGAFNVNPDDVPFSTAYSSTFDLQPKAWLSTHLINQNLSQTAIFAIDAETETCTACCTSASNIIQGFPIDSVFTCQVYGEQQALVSGTYVDLNGAVHQISESVFVAAFDTTTVTIIY
jgi:hypothetical protein